MKAGKVWGETRALLQNPVVEFHRIEVNAGGECSTHKHSHKWNGFFIEEGEMEIHVYKNDYELVGFNDNSENLITDYNKAFSHFESEFEI